MVDHASSGTYWSVARRRSGAVLLARRCQSCIVSVTLSVISLVFIELIYSICADHQRANTFWIFGLASAHSFDAFFFQPFNQTMRAVIQRVTEAKVTIG